MPVDPSAVDRSPDGSTPGTHGEHLRDSVRSAYEDAPRGERGPLATSPGTWNPRWRPALLAAVLLAVIIVGGLTTRVPVETSAVVTETSADRLVVAPMQGEVPASGTSVTLLQTNPGGDVRESDGIVTTAPDGTLVVELTVAPSAAVGEQVSLRSGSRPLLTTLLRSG